MNLTFEIVNWWAVLAAAAASFVIGGLWYAVIFGKAWARVYGYTPEQLAAMGARPQVTFPVLLLCDLVAAVAVAVLVSMTRVAGAGDGLALGFILWVGVAGALGLATHIGNGRPPAGWAIDSGKQLASLLAMGAIIGAWR